MKVAPTILIIHPHRSYDKAAVARQGMRETLQSIKPAMVLQIHDGLNKDIYMNTPSFLTDKDALQGTGILLDKKFFSIRYPLFKTDTFIIIGGRICRCVTNALLSTLVYKIYDFSSVQKSDLMTLEVLNYKWRDNVLPTLKRISDISDLNFHFNMYASYPSTWDFKYFGKEAEVLWSGNMLYEMAVASITRHWFLVKEFKVNSRSFLNGSLVNTAIEAKGLRMVNMYYWVDTASMAKAING